MKPIIININILGNDEKIEETLSGVLQTVQTSFGGKNSDLVSPDYRPATWQAPLSDEHLHFLRVFIHCEGKIKDVEKALGVSYPTVKSKLADLKQQLAHTSSSPDRPEQSPIPLEILEQLNNGNIDLNTALEKLKNGAKK